MVLELRTSADESLDTDVWLQAVQTGFQRSATLTQEQLAARREVFDLSRLQGYFDGDRCVATYRSFDQRLTVPGGTDVAAHAVTGVTVTATHRRRGLLTRMMSADLSAAKEQGELLSTLIAAEYRIYGRFGYGPATRLTEVEIDGTRSGLDGGRAVPESAGSVDFIDGAEVRKLGPELHERHRLRHPGATNRTVGWWRAHTGELPVRPDWQEPFHALYRDPDGVVQGLLTFTLDGKWTRSMPDNTATVQDMLAITTEAERALCHFLLSLDWVTRVAVGHQQVDALLPDLLPEPRAAQVIGASDFLWIRPLDVPGMLQSRGYTAEGELVLEVTDRLGLAAGRFLLTAAPEGADCVPTGRGADLTLEAGTLGTLYLGDQPASRLAALGLISEHTPGAAALADRLLYTARRPWAYDIF